MAAKPIIGNVTVGGARKEISGGYVNIGGVWKPISKTYVNVNGVWKNAWENLYTWKKYTVVANTVKEAVRSSMKTSMSQDVTVAIRYASTYTFNTSTGVFALKSPTSGTLANLSSAKKYYMMGTTTSGSKMLEFRSLGGVTNNKGTLTYYEYTSKDSEAEVQGTYISDVTSENASAYPTNGKHTDGYWYVKQ